MENIRTLVISLHALLYHLEVTDTIQFLRWMLQNSLSHGIWICIENISVKS